METELNELIVSPIGSLSEDNAVTMVIPVAKLASVLRKSREQKSCVADVLPEWFAVGVVDVILGFRREVEGMLRSVPFREVQESHDADCL